MIPYQLRLRNFLSYGSVVQTIDFEPHRLICLTGKNGHGKSALLDAITWALWGQARKAAGASKTDELLVRLGQSHMMVSLDFLCGKNRYRVTRELVLVSNKKAQVELQLGIYNSEQNTYAPLTEKSIRATQEKIIALLGLDFDACVNSIFLRQGQSQEFSKRSPQERKEVLASMLGLTVYDDLKACAVEHVREGNKETALLQQQIVALQEELVRQESVRLRLSEVEKNLAQFSLDELEMRAHIDRFGKDRVLLQERLQLMRIAQVQFEQQQVLLAQKKRDFELLIRTWRSVNRMRRAHYLSEVGERAVHDLEKELLEYEKARLKQAAIKEELFLCSEKRHLLIQKVQERYTVEQTIRAGVLQSTRSECDSFERKHAELLVLDQRKEKALNVLVSDFNANFEGLKEDQARYNESLKKLTKMERATVFLDRWRMSAAAIDKELMQVALDREALKSPGTVCPLCVQELSHEHRAGLEEKLERRTQFLNHRRDRLSRAINSLALLLKNLSHCAVEVKNLFKSITQREQLVNAHKARMSELEVERAHIIEESKSLNIHVLEAQERIVAAQKACDEWIAGRDKFIAVQPEFVLIEATYAQLQNALSEIVYDAGKEADLKVKLSARRQKHVEAEVLRGELAKQVDRVQQIHSLSSELRVLKGRCNELMSHMQGLSELEGLLKVADQNVQDRQKEIVRISEVRGPLLQEKGALSQQLLTFEKQAVLCREKLAKKERFAQLLEDYQLLSLALGKNGIQALIIENAIPEIEYEANALLARLTDNQAHVMFESVRDLKGGGTKETLDIKISDSMGIRPYEFFSGGEAFRIDFALRIAISKLLARRSGTSLQTLIIDEGFGSQDEEGLAHLMEALYDIQGDFEKIIVVSHLQGMKSQFPTNFFVQKETDGSVVTVVEQG